MNGCHWRRTPIGLLLTVFSLLLLAGCANTSVLTPTGAAQERTTLGVRLRVTPADSIAIALDDGRSEALQVVSVKPRQSAAAAGIQVGDILLDLNDTPITGMAESVAIMQRARWGDVLIVRVLRGAQLLQIPVTLQRQHSASAVPPEQPSLIADENPKPVVTFKEQTTGPLLPPGDGERATVAVARAIVRAAASTSSDIVVSLARGTPVQVTATVGGWYAIVTRDGRDIPGYIHASLLQR